MPFQAWISNANTPGQGAGSALASSTTLTDISAGGASSSAFYTQTYGPMYVGQRWRLTAHGIASSTSTPTLLLGFYYGGVAGTALAATAATSINTGAAWPWRLELLMSVRSLGSSGTIWCQGWADFPTSLTAVTRTAIPTTNVQLVTVNTATNSALTVGAQWSASSSSNTVTCEDFLIEQMN